MNGGLGNDILSGGSGNDILMGGDGLDWLIGGSGVNRMSGGAGNDLFVSENTADVINAGDNAGADVVMMANNDQSELSLVPNVEVLPTTWNNVKRAVRLQDLSPSARAVWKSFFGGAVGTAGAIAVPAGAAEMERRAAANGSAERTLESRDLSLFRGMFGDWVDGVRVYYGVPPLSHWSLGGGMQVDIGDYDGQSFGYKIYVRKNFDQLSREDRVLLLTHELVHARQYREAGESLAKFGERYFRGFVESGNYEDNPMETEAYDFAAANEAMILQVLATPTPVPTAWQQVGGAAKDIATGADGSIWAIGTNSVGAGSDFGIYKWDGSTWQNQGGGAVRIAVASNGQPWVVNSAGQIFRREGTGWVQMPGGAKDIATGADGSVWVIGTNLVGAASDFGIYQWDGSAWQNKGGGGVQIAVSRDSQPWVVNSRGQIFRLV